MACRPLGLVQSLRTQPAFCHYLMLAMLALIWIPFCSHIDEISITNSSWVRSNVFSPPMRNSSQPASFIVNMVNDVEFLFLDMELPLHLKNKARLDYYHLPHTSPDLTHWYFVKASMFMKSISLQFLGGFSRCG